jgi:hypothetical protein
MCQQITSTTGQQCPLPDDFWVMTSRKSTTNCGCLYRPNQLACYRHLPQAIARIAELNDQMAHGMSDPNHDGVTVKTRHVNAAKGWEYWS